MNATSPAATSPVEVETVGWVGDAAEGILRLIDQTRLPTEFARIDCRDVPRSGKPSSRCASVERPAIGIAAAYGAVLGGQTALAMAAADAVRQAILAASAHLRTSRPTAVNLFWALDRIDRVAADEAPGSASAIARARAGRGPRDRRRGPGDVPRDRPLRRRPARARAGRPDPLQRRRPGHRRLRHRAGRHLRRPRAGQDRPRLCRRDPPAAPGGAADGLGAARSAACPSR